MNFDKHKDNYRDQVRDSLKGSGADSDFILEYKADLLCEIVKKYLGNKKIQELQVLDFGCGIGIMDQYWSKTFQFLTGIDLSSGSIEIAKKSNPRVRYFSYDGGNFPFAPDEKFDVIVAVCVFHHIPPDQWKSTFENLKKSLENQGVLVIFEHNPLNPATQWVVSRCELDNDAVLLRSKKLNQIAQSAGYNCIETESILYFPWRGKIFRFIESLFRKIPLGAQYYSVFMKK